MLNAMLEVQGKRFSHDLAMRGYHVVYREGQSNHCPGCGHSHWYIGRLSAECGFCGTALPLAEATARGAAGLSRGHSQPVADAA